MGATHVIKLQRLFEAPRDAPRHVSKRTLGRIGLAPAKRLNVHDNDAAGDPPIIALPEARVRVWAPLSDSGAV